MAIGRRNVENMLNLTNPKLKTAITRVEPNRIITRGYPQEDLIGNISFPEMVYLLMKGELPQKIFQICSKPFLYRSATMVLHHQVPRLHG